MAGANHSSEVERMREPRGAEIRSVRSGGGVSVGMGWDKGLLGGEGIGEGEFTNAGRAKSASYEVGGDRIVGILDDFWG